MTIRRLFAFPPASLSTAANILQMMTKLLKLLPLTTQFMPQPIQWLFMELLLAVSSIACFVMIPFSFLIFHSMPSFHNKISHLKPLLFPVDRNTVHFTEMWLNSPINGHSSRVDSCVFFRNDWRHGIKGSTIIYVCWNTRVSKFGNQCLDAIDDAIWVTVSCELQTYLRVGCLCKPPNADTKFDKLLTNIFFIASHKPHAFKFIGDDLNLSNIIWTSTSKPGRYNKLIKTIELCAWIQ